MTNNTSNEGYLISRGYSYYVFALLFLLFFYERDLAKVKKVKLVVED